MALEKRESRHKKFEALRKRAENLLEASVPESRSSAHNQISHLLQELQIYQIELELQNEELQSTQRRLEISRNQYARLYDLAPVGYFTLDPDGLTLNVNLAGAELLGVGRKHLVNKPLSVFVAGDSHEKFLLHRQRALETGMPQSCELTLIKRGGEKIYVRMESVAAQDPENTQTVHLLTAVLDISKQKMMVDQIRSNEQYFRSLTEKSSDIIQVLDETGSHRYISPSISLLLGYSVEELANTDAFQLIHPDDLPQIQEKFQKLLNVPAWILSSDVRIQHKNGYWRTLKVTARNLLDDPNINGIVVNSYDTTDYNMALEAIKTSLQEKEVLLKEIHHRVKNNLQIIHSLLSLQSGYFTDERVTEALRDSQNRVRSMALVHERLYQSEDLARVNSAGYIKSLVNQLYRSYHNLSHAVKIETHVESGLIMPVDQAIPCGLIINELVTNALKHAFSTNHHDRAKANIRVSLQRDEQQYMLAVSDNGVGLPQELDFYQPTTLGLQLVNMLSHQLDGVLTVSHRTPFGQGTHVKIVFSR